jgi:predicted ATPase
MVMAYARPSDGVRAAVAAVAEAQGDATAAVTTAELNDEKVIAERLRAIIDAGQSGSVLVSLATQELSRSLLSSDYRFEGMTTVEVPSGGVERVFFLSHPSLTPPKTETARTELDHREGFIGRRRELEDIANRLDRARIVTVVGPSGIGKSALIRRFVALNDHSFADGVIEVDLSAMTQAAVVGPTLLRLSGAVRLPGESALDAFVAHMRDRKCLLVLDNAEGVLPEVRRVVSALIRGAPNVAILIGSQRAMRLPGEARVKVSGLETPIGVEHLNSLEDYEAIALFLDRAQLVDPDFRLSRENAPVLIRLCQRLDGIPLAIEMAAAKINILSPRQILNRLDDRFLLLTDNSPSRPDRHRTLRATIDWGHDQLRPEAKVLLRRLAPFAGAFSVEEATKLAADDSLTEEQVFAAFDELAEASLLATSSVGGDEKRFYLTETVRLYARERLRKAGEDRIFEIRHREWCLDLARRGGPGLMGADLLEWLNRIDAAYEDLRQAIEAETVPRGDLEMAMEILIAVQTYFVHRTYLAEGLRLCEKVLRAGGVNKKAQYPQLLNTACNLSMRMGNMASARRFAYQCYRAARKRSDGPIAGLARSNMAAIAQGEDRLLRARRHFLAAAQLFRQAGMNRRLLNVLVNLIATEVDLDEPQVWEHLEEAKSKIAEERNPVLAAYFNLNWAHLEIVRGSPRTALELCFEAANFLVGSRDKSGMHTCWRNIAYALERLGRPHAAAFFIGAAGRLARSGEFYIAPKYEQAWQNLSTRVRGELDHRYDDIESEGAMSSDEEVRERIEYESSK